jgi:hypothetical protein
MKYIAKRARHKIINNFFRPLKGQKVINNFSQKIKKTILNFVKSCPKDGEYYNISGTDLDGKIERSVYNKRRRKLFPYIEKIRETLSSKFSDFTDVFIVESTPIEICKISRANRSAICSTDEIKPSFGYCAAQKTRYFGYKLHAVCDKNGIFHSFDFSPANIHDVNYLCDIKENFQNCLLIGDRGYISKEFQVDLFNQSSICLSVPMRKNQHNFVAFSRIKSKIMKRIETNISQRCGPFSINVNFAKTFQGLATRIVSKITSFTMIQYLHFFVFKKKFEQIKSKVMLNAQQVLKIILSS